MKMKNKDINKREMKPISERITYQGLIDRVAEILKQARAKALREINKAQVLAYWEIGMVIVEFQIYKFRESAYIFVDRME